MNVRELIQELLECKMDAEVNIQVFDIDDNYEEIGFEVQFNLNEKEVNLIAELNNHNIVGSNDYLEMQDRLEELEDEQ